MSLLSVIVLVILLTSMKTESKEQVAVVAPSVQNFKEFVTNMIKEQSSKIQTLLKKIQINAQSVLTKIENMKQVSKTSLNDKYSDTLRKYLKLERQVESPIEKIDPIDVREDSRSFNNYLTSTGYGASGNANYATHLQTYHHHSIGFDPINIVVSVSLLSFLLQAIQGLLNRTRLPTPVVEARSLNPLQNWLKNFDDNKFTKDNMKNKYPKKYYH